MSSKGSIAVLSDEYVEIITTLREARSLGATEEAEELEALLAKVLRLYRNEIGVRCRHCGGALTPTDDADWAACLCCNRLFSLGYLRGVPGEPAPQPPAVGTCPECGADIWLLEVEGFAWRRCSACGWYQNELDL